MNKFGIKIIKIADHDLSTQREDRLKHPSKQLAIQNNTI
jgi:hypothetical protein